MMALASRASSRAVATTPRRGPSASARASAEVFFADGDIDRGCNAALGTCGRLDIIFGTATRRRRCSSVAARPWHPAMARNHRIGRGRLENLLKSADCQHGGGGEALVTGVLNILFF